MLTTAKNLYHRYERWVPIAFFLLGFLFDTFMLRHVDELKTILQQAAYLVLAGGLIRIELIESQREVHPPKFLSKVWKYREALLHFLLGTLLNSYTIFYFKSASALSSFVFIVLLILLLILNEFKRFGKSQTQVHVALLSLCLISYLVSLVPILMGSIGVIPFLISLAASLFIFWGYVRLMPKLPRIQLVYPFAAIQLVFVALFFMHAIPPVPLSVSYMGIFHDVQKGDGEYHLSYSRAWWKFWQHGDQTFSARPGDTLYCFARIFSPTRFKDQLQIRWFYRDHARGWLPSDAIPLIVEGGREEGYRAVTFKRNYQPGSWKVQIETTDSREVGHIHFSIESDLNNDERMMSVMSQ